MSDPGDLEQYVAFQGQQVLVGGQKFRELQQMLSSLPAAAILGVARQDQEGSEMQVWMVRTVPEVGLGFQQITIDEAMARMAVYAERQRQQFDAFYRRVQDYPIGDPLARGLE